MEAKSQAERKAVEGLLRELEHRVFIALSTVRSMKLTQQFVVCVCVTVSSVVDPGLLISVMLLQILKVPVPI